LDTSISETTTNSLPKKLNPNEVYMTIGQLPQTTRWVWRSSRTNNIGFRVIVPIVADDYSKPECIKGN
jgi:hypothetical protein